MLSENYACFGGLPTWFRAACAEARSGQRTYRDIGRHLAGHLPGMLEADIPDDEEIDRRLEELRTALRARDREAAATWLRRELPRMMPLVPSRKIGKLVQGFEDEYDLTDLAR